MAGVAAQANPDAGLCTQREDGLWFGVWVPHPRDLV